MISWTEEDNMKQWLIAGAIVLTITFITPIADAASAEGVGVRPCEYFMQVYKADPANDELWFSWAQGFLSGMNIARLNDTPGMFKRMSMEEQKDHIRSFCQANPKKKYFEAVGVLYTRLDPLPK